MSARSLRRAAERAAKNQAISAARLAANRANAQFSTGPTSDQGRAVSSHNALKTGLTGQAVLLPTDDEAAYQAHIHAYLTELGPVGIQESDLVQSIADLVWRLKRIPVLEKMIYIKGRKEFAEMFADADPTHRAGLLDLHIYEVNAKKLRNLQLQEARLSRRREKEVAELRRLQAERAEREIEAAELDPAMASIFQTDTAPPIDYLSSGKSPASEPESPAESGETADYDPSPCQSE